MDSGGMQLGTSVPAIESAHHVSQRWIIPRQVGMRASLPTNQVVVFQSNQQVESIVSAVYDKEIDRSVVALTSQWRLDFPRENHRGIHESATRRDTLLSIVEKLLTRGSFSYTTPDLESFIVSRSGLDPLAKDRWDRLLESTLQAVAATPTSPYVASSFDSTEEEQFRDYVLKNTGPEWSCLEQVDFGSLVGPLSGGGGRRIDFLLTRSDGETAAVEVDGEQHSESVHADAARDRELAVAGFAVVRVSTEELREGGGRGLEAVDDFVARPLLMGTADESVELALRLGKLTHQVQVAIVQALFHGWLPVAAPWRLAVGPPRSYLDPVLVQEASQVAADSCADLVRRVFELYGEPGAAPGAVVELASNAGRSDITISFGSEADAQSDAPLFRVADVCFPAAIAAPVRIAQPMDVGEPSRGHTKYFLDYIFRKSEFFEGQWEAIERTLKGLDSIVLLPTGGGKSIAFQLSALLRPGCCVVVDPIIALMEDQIDNLRKVGIDRCLEISSQRDRNVIEREQVMMQQGHYLFIYVAPERFQMEEFRQALRTLVTSVLPVSQVAVDEAHCVSEWGHDFRTPYLNLSRNAREYCKSPSSDSPPPIIALTGTASRMVLKDIQRDLDIREDFNAVITPRSFDRAELQFLAAHARSSETVALLKGIIQSLPAHFNLSSGDFFSPADTHPQAGIVFTSTVNGSKGTESLLAELTKVLPTRIESYSGSPPGGVDTNVWNQTKRAVTARFKHNSTQVLVATKAYGMGIDKPDVRYTVHFGLPHSIESFYQEAGRAGRDRRRAICGIVFSDDDAARSQDLLNETTTMRAIVDVIRDTPRSQQDDVLQALWFHTQAFKGVEQEAQDVARLVNGLRSIGESGTDVTSWRAAKHDGEKVIERALHRLVILGVVHDYTVGHSRKEFRMILGRINHAGIADHAWRYIAEYQRPLADNLRDELLRLRDQPMRDYTIAAARKIIEFVYDHVEKSRRRALYEMLEAARSAASSANSDQVLRGRILRHLEWSEFDDVLDGVVRSDHGGLDCIGNVIDQIAGPTDAGSLRGAVARLLESYPDQPGLLVIRGLSEALARDANLQAASQNVQSALTFAKTTYKVETEVIADALSRVVNTALRKEDAGNTIIRAIADHEELDRDLARSLLESIPYSEAEPLRARLAHELSGLLRQLARVHHDKQQR